MKPGGWLPWLSLAALLLGLAAHAQTLPAAQKPAFVSSERRLLTAPELLDAPDEWISRSFQWVDYVLRNYPPAVVEAPVRRAALIRLDDILHIESAPRKALVQEFYRRRMEAAVREIEQTRVTEGMRIWKLYNAGFLIRTAAVSFTFDIVPGVVRLAEFSVPAELLERLAAQSDAHFISHEHLDHANQDVVRIFLKQNKPVIAPEGLWKDTPDLASRMIYPKRDAAGTYSVPVRGGVAALKVVTYPGHQGETILNNVNLVITPEGFSVLQTGDQSGSEGPGGDWDWLTQIGRDHHVDVLLPNCWQNALGRTIRGVNPELVITAHENEMGHTVDHREDYTQTYNHLFGVRYPFIVMTWGESYHYRTEGAPR
ncbi:MAG: MBL fold metallo-hydrolase [Bryobacterales bacterium]|nr:MBL fold metallo-hydrolase [Bryobacterales bacterium]